MFGEDLSPGVQGYLCLRACQVCHCYPVGQQNRSYHPFFNTQMQCCHSNTNLNIRPLQICQGVQGVHGDQEGPWEGKHPSCQIWHHTALLDMIPEISGVFLHSVRALRAHQGVRCVPEVPVQPQEAKVQITGEGNGAGLISVSCQSKLQQRVWTHRRSGRSRRSSGAHHSLEIRNGSIMKQSRLTRPKEM